MECEKDTTFGIVKYRSDYIWAHSQEQDVL